MSQTLVALTLLTILLASIVSSHKVWYNYNTQLKCEPTDIEFPDDEASLISFIQEKSSNTTYPPLYKLVGAGHSYSNVSICVNYNSTSRRTYVINLKNLTNISIDTNTNLVTIGAGWTIQDLMVNLSASNLTIENLGTSRVQQFVGAFITGTHGTGRNFQNFASTVKAVKLLKADGSILQLSETESPDIFNAARLSIGSLGIIIEATFQAVPQYKLKRRDIMVDSLELINHIFEFYTNNSRFMAWGPVIDTDKASSYIITNPDGCDQSHEAWIKDTTRITIWEETTDEITPDGCASIADCSEQQCEKMTPHECVDYADISLAASPTQSHDDQWHVGIEHFVPLENYKQMLYDYASLQCKQAIFNDSRVNTTMQVRFVKSDDIPLSEVYHEINGVNHSHFGVLEVQWNVLNQQAEVLWRYQTYAMRYREDFGVELGIRPHWGKPNWVDLEYGRELYPKFDDFIAIRNELDPECQFMNQYLITLFGLEEMCGGIFGDEPVIVYDTTEWYSSTTTTEGPENDSRGNLWSIGVVVVGVFMIWTNM